MDSTFPPDVPTDSPPKKRPLRWVSLIAKFVLPVALVGFLIYRIPAENWEQIGRQPKNYGLLVAAILVALGAMSVSFVRWCVLVRAQGIELTMTEAFRLGAIGYLLSFVSAGSVGGDLFKAVFLARRRPGRRVAAFASVLVDRGCGLYGLLLLVAAGLWFVGPVDPPSGDQWATATSPSVEDSAGGPRIQMDHIRVATLALVAAGTAVLAVLVLGGKIIDRWIASLSRVPVIGGVISRVGPPLRTFHEHPLAFGLAVVLSLVVQALLVLSMYLIASGLYSNPPTLAQHFVIVPIGMLVAALPLTPAGMGVLEVAIDSMYRLFQPEDAVASGTLVALVFELVKLVVAMVGTVFYWTAGTDVRETVEAAERETEAAAAGSA